MISPGGAARGQTVNRILTDGRRGAVPSTTPHDLRSRLRISPTPPLSLCYDRTRLRRANETKPSGQMERQVWEGLTNFNTPARAQPIQARSPCLPDMSRASDRPPTSLCPRQSGASMYLRWSATPVPAVLRHVLRPLWVRAPTRTRDAPGPLLLARRRPPSRSLGQKRIRPHHVLSGIHAPPCDQGGQIQVRPRRRLSGRGGFRFGPFAGRRVSRFERARHRNLNTALVCAGENRAVATHPVLGFRRNP